jgi:Homeodomain-like domain
VPATHLGNRVARRSGSFSVYQHRYLANRLAGLEPRSRRLRSSPAQIAPEREAEICRMRKDHPRWGARRIRAELRPAGADPPAVSTIHQALKRNHLVAAQPPRRQRASKRCERELPKDLWQIGATQVALAARERAWVIDVVA